MAWIWLALIVLAFVGGFAFGHRVATRDTEQRWSDAVKRKEAYDKWERQR